VRLRDKEKQKEYARKHYLANREKMIQRAREDTVRRRKILRKYIDNAKDVPCLDCGNKYPPIAMDFDHISNDKLYNVATMVNAAFSIQTVVKEMAKCEIVCAVCHRIRTYNRRNGVVVARKAHNLSGKVQFLIPQQ
jgi:hypothetical protein